MSPTPKKNSKGAGPKGSPLPSKLRNFAAELNASVGEEETIKRLGVSRQSLGRILGGLSVHRSTRALVAIAAEQASARAGK
jgi:hypothetical protein